MYTGGKLQLHMIAFPCAELNVDSPSVQLLYIHEEESFSVGGDKLSLGADTDCSH